MPAVPTNAKRFSAFSKKDKETKEAARQQRAVSDAATQAALEEMGRAAARELGCDPSQITMIVCSKSAG